MKTLIPTSANATIYVGARFEVSEEHPWFDKNPINDGPRNGVHRYRAIIEVTRVKYPQAEYKTVRVLEESGRPSWGFDPADVTGGFSIPLFQPSRFKVVLQ
jgi:hypothetical protein